MNQAESSKVTTIDPERDIITMINTFTLKPEKQQPFIEAQTGEYKRLSAKIEGSLAANLHRGRGGAKAVNYAQWRSLDEFRRWTQGDQMKEHMPAIQPYIERFQPGVYRVVDVVARDARIAHITESETAVALIVVMTAEPGAVGEVVAAQREAAKRLVEDLPGVRALAIHQSVQMPGPAGPGGQPLPDAALYAQLDGEAAARALLEHPTFRASFTTEHARIQAAESEVYTVVYVQDEAWTQGS